MNHARSEVIENDNSQSMTESHYYMFYILN